MLTAATYFVCLGKANKPYYASFTIQFFVPRNKCKIKIKNVVSLNWNTIYYAKLNWNYTKKYVTVFLENINNG